MEAFLSTKTPVAARLSSPINFPSSGGNPFAGIGVNVGNDNLIARWTGNINIPTSGLTNFWTNSDDGTMLFIDGLLVVNNNYFQGMTTRNGSIDLTAGQHAFDMFFYEGDGGAGAIAEWQPFGGTRAIIPIDVFSFEVTDPSMAYWQTLAESTGILGDLLGGNLVSLYNFNLHDQYMLRLTADFNGDTIVLQDTFLFVPEPTTLCLLGAGLAVLARRRRNRR